MTPITREEYFLAKINGDDVPTPAPITRIERYLDIIAGNDGTILPPVTREEFYLAKIAGLDIAVPEPETRIEKYLAAIAGSDISVPIPITRREFYLFAWAEEHPETYTGKIVSFIAKKAKPILNLTATLEPIQDLHGYDSPWPAGGGINKWNPDTTSKEWVNPQNVISEIPIARSMRYPCTSGTVVTLSNDNDSSSANVLMLTFLGENDAVLSRNVVASGAKYISRTAVANTVEVLAAFILTAKQATHSWKSAFLLRQHTHPIATSAPSQVTRG